MVTLQGTRSKSSFIAYKEEEAKKGGSLWGWISGTVKKAAKNIAKVVLGSSTAYVICECCSLK